MPLCHTFDAGLTRWPSVADTVPTAPERFAEVPLGYRPRGRVISDREGMGTTMPKARPKGTPTSTEEAKGLRWAQAGEALTTANGIAVDDTDNSLRVGARGPTLLDDFHLREKIMRFDHERIPERVVHARGAAAHGHFQLYDSLEKLTDARVLTDTTSVTPTFVRFSTVAGSRGSADTARDVRGFATKFYTAEGIWDLVGNNMPVFFIQDGIKFPDLIHAAKPEPDREIPQAQTAHDTFWDFVSLTPESTHMLMWAMSDRGIPRSFRTMEGFGVHTFRLANSRGSTKLVKFHWKPVAGVHSLVWEEAQLLAGFDPDFHRRDLWTAIESGIFPEYELGIQIFPDNEDQTFDGIDLLDPTKLVPEELAPVRIVGRMTLDANPSNYFAETEQVAFCTAHVPRGIDFTDDPLLQARNFSYFDTQLTRLGGPNFDQIPINRSVSPVNTNERDGYGQQAVHTGVSAYSPNSLAGGCPVSPTELSYVHVPRKIEGKRVRERAASFSDHYGQATLFWNSMSPVERTHIVLAFSFELSKCEHPEIRSRMVDNLGRVSKDLAGKVAHNLGLKVVASRGREGTATSPALSQLLKAPGPVSGRVVGVLINNGVDAHGVSSLQRALKQAGARIQVIAPHGGTIASDEFEITVDKTVPATRSVEFDSLVIAGGQTTEPLGADPAIVQMFDEAYCHHKLLAAWGNGVAALNALGVPDNVPGVLRSPRASAAFGREFVEALGWHRFWDRP